MKYIITIVCIIFSVFFIGINLNRDAYEKFYGSYNRSVEHFTSNNRDHIYLTENNNGTKYPVILNNITEEVSLSNDSSAFVINRDSQITINSTERHRTTYYNLNLNRCIISFMFKFNDNNNNMRVANLSDRLAISIRDNRPVILLSGSSHEIDMDLNANEYYTLILIITDSILTVLLDGNKKRIISNNLRNLNNIILGDIFEGNIGNIQVFKDICEFIPSGKTISQCVQKCKKSSNKCGQGYCNLVCESCDNEDCKWVNFKRSYLKQNFPAPIIYVKTFRGEAQIHWTSPYKDIKMDAYVVFLYKTKNPEQGTKMTLTAFPHCNNCIHTITGLEEKTQYTVYIRAYKKENNKELLSAPSNKETFEPKLRLLSSDFKYKPEVINNSETYDFCE